MALAINPTGPVPVDSPHAVNLLLANRSFIMSTTILRAQRYESEMLAAKSQDTTYFQNLVTFLFGINFILLFISGVMFQLRSALVFIESSAFTLMPFVSTAVNHALGAFAFPAAVGTPPWAFHLAVSLTDVGTFRRQVSQWASDVTEALHRHKRLITGTTNDIRQMQETIKRLQKRVKQLESQTPANSSREWSQTSLTSVTNTCLLREHTSPQQTRLTGPPGTAFIDGRL